MGTNSENLKVMQAPLAVALFLFFVLNFDVCTLYLGSSNVGNNAVKQASLRMVV